MKKYTFCILFFYWNFSKAQVLFCLEKGQNAISFSNGINKSEPFFTASYAHCFHINLFNVIKDDVTFFVDVADRSNFYNDNTFRFIYGGQGNLIGKRKFKLPFRKTFTVTRFNSVNYQATYLGAEIELMPGIYTPKYFVAIDLYYGDNLRGHLSETGTTSEVLQVVGKGWFKPHVANFRTGINVGVHLCPYLCVYGNLDFYAIRPKDTEIPYYSSFPRALGLIGVNYLF